MGYVIDQLIWWLLLTALGAGVAGWAFHQMRTAPAVETLERQRDQLRRDLIAFVSGAPDSAGLAQHERETDLLRTRAEVSDGRIAALEHALEEARSGREEALTRIGELERAGAHAQDESAELERLRTLAAEAEDRRAAELEVEAAPAPDANALRWRMRYLESRTRYLEGLTAGAEETAAQLVAAQARIAALESAPQTIASAPTPAPPAGAADLNPLRWQARYFEARVRYLEAAAAAPTPVLAVAETPPQAEPTENTEEAEQRRRWRMRYLETRLGHVEEIAADAAGAWAQTRAALEARGEELMRHIDDREAQLTALRPQLAARDARVAELETHLPLAARARRLTWRARYLEARVRHLETTTPAAPSAAELENVSHAPEEALLAPAPLVAPGQEVRPQALPAARDGAPDDFTLIEGVSPLQQSTLNALGIYHYDQIAAWTDENIAWVDQYLRLRGRIGDEAWVAQADALARGDALPRAAE